MPPNGLTLGGLIQTNIDNLMSSVSGSNGGAQFQGVHPLQQKNPSYYIAFCNAVGGGLISGGPVIGFTTTDSGVAGSPPVTGAGIGVGIFIDKEFFREQAYTNARNAILAKFSQTVHDPYPPGEENTGQFLDAICNGIATSVHDYYQTAWSLTSVHPQIYQGAGAINDGQFFGLSPSAIASAIESLLPNFQGEFLPDLIQAISEAYVLTITTKAVGTVTITGACVSSDSQVCGIPSSGAGTGTAS